MVNAAYGDQALTRSNVSNDMDDFVMEEWLAYRVSQ